MEALAGKRLLFVITKSNWGGAQSYVHTLARHYKEAGADVAVALGGTGLPGSETGMLAERLRESGVRIIIIPSFARDISFFREWQAFRELLDLVKHEEPDILHVNSSKAAGIGALAGRLAKVPRIIFTAHGWAHHEPRSGIIRLFIWAASWATVVLSHKVIVLSEYHRRTAPVLFSRKKLEVIMIGVDSFPLEPKDEARHFLAPDIPELKKLTQWIVIVAELTKNKGIDNAVRSFAGVSTNIDSVALVVIHEGEEHERLSKLIESYRLQKRAFLLGFVPDARRYLKAADIFLLPSRKEGLPLAILEAGNAELPVISTRVGGIPEVIEHKRSGLLVRANDIDGLADAMTRLLTHPDEAKDYAETLKKRVTGKFTEKEMLEKTAKVYIG
jgi:glycosyltransferase involved in cell wall biosynthesis